MLLLLPILSKVYYCNLGFWARTYERAATAAATDSINAKGLYFYNAILFAATNLG